ncbi:hypothetical protein ACTFIU_006412 [Dictyostelium citrinum]
MSLLMIPNGLGGKIEVGLFLKVTPIEIEVVGHYHVVFEQIISKNYSFNNLNTPTSSQQINSASTAAGNNSTTITINESETTMSAVTFFIYKNYFHDSKNINDQS